jgi:hypothetical protein
MDCGAVLLDGGSRKSNEWVPEGHERPALWRMAAFDDRDGQQVKAVLLFP